MQRVYLRSEEIRILRLFLKEYGAKLDDHDGLDADALSVRELQVLRLLAGGSSTVQIATRLIISVHTAKSHISAIISKLHAPNARAAIAVALKLKIISISEIEPQS
jgi:DNA-binding NarL/FixJ family response regulator